MIDSQSHVFISYSRANKDFVDRLTADLQARGLTVWIDKQGLKPGAPSWEQALRDAISASRAVLLIATPDSRKSPYVGDELGIAAMYKRPVYPVWAGGQEWLDSIRMGLGSVQFIDARETRYAAALEEIVTALSGTSAQPHAAAPGIEPTFEPRNPYKGLNAFTGEDRGDFFGRDALIAELRAAVEALTVPRFLVLAVVGPSGSGKSSVVMAGLLPQLQDAHADWVFLPPMVPGVHPLERLSIALAERLSGSLSDLRKDLDDPSTRGLHLLANRLARKAGQRVVLLVDQFEELFTLTADERERQQFIDLLTTAVSEPEGALLALITLRADFWDRPLRYAELGKLISEHNAPVLPLSLSDLRDVIEKPAALPDVQMRFDDGLVAELVFDVRGQPGALPLLQFTLEQLFERRDGHRLTQVAYHEMGGVKGALAKHAEATYAALPTEEHRNLTRALFLRLIEPGAAEQETTRRRASLSELTLPDSQQTALMREAADAFVKARLLTTGEVAGLTTIEVSHEALIREWERLGNWLKDARDDVRLQKQISQDAAEWVRRGKRPDDDGLYRGTVLEDAQAWAKRSVPSADEVALLGSSAKAEAERKARDAAIARRAQNFGRAAVVLAVVGLLAVIATVVAIMQATNAQAQVADANSRMDNANQEIATIQQQVVNAGNTLTPVPQTLAPIGSTLDSMRVTQTAVSKHIEPMRLMVEANNVLQTDGADPGLAALLSIRALQITYSPQADTTLLRATARLYLRRLITASSGINSIAVSPDGKYILSGNIDRAQLWNAETGATIHEFTSPYNELSGAAYGYFFVASVAFSPDGNYILTGSQGSVALWNARTGERVRGFTEPPSSIINLSYSSGRNRSATGRILGGGGNDVVSTVFSPDEKYVLVGYKDTAQIWDANTGEELYELSGHDDRLTSAIFSPDGKYILTGSYDNTAILWDAQTHKRLCRLSGHTASVNSVAFSPDGSSIATGSGDNTARLWDAATCKELRRFVGHIDRLSEVTFSPDGTELLTGSDDGTARLWDTQTGRELRRYIGHTQAISSVAFSPDGKSVVTGSSDSTARLWDTPMNADRQPFIDHASNINGLTVSRDGRLILAVGFGGAGLWDAQTGKELQDFPDAMDINSAALSPDGKYLLTGNNLSKYEDNLVRLWDVQTGKELRRYLGHKESVTSVAFSPDGRYGLTGSDDGTTLLWDIQSGNLLRQFEVPSGRLAVKHVEFAADMKQVLILYQSGSVVIWDGILGSGHSSLAGEWQSALLSPDGKYIFTASSDIKGHLWDAKTLASVRQFTGHTGSILSATFSPDSKYIVTGGHDDTARLWDVQTGMELREYGDRTASMTGVAFSPDGSFILTARGDGTVWRWDTNLERSIALACERLVQDMNRADRDRFGIEDENPTCPKFAPETLALTPTATVVPTSTIPPWTPLPTPTLESELLTSIPEVDSRATYLPMLQKTQTQAVLGAETAEVVANNNATALFSLEQTQTAEVKPLPSLTPRPVTPTPSRTPTPP